MKRNLLFNQLTAIGKRLAMVLTMLLIVGIGQAWGEEVTINANQITGFGSGSNYTSSSITIDDITIASNSGFSTTQFRVAKSKNLVISCAGKMTKIVFTVSSTSYKLNATGITWNNTSGTYTNASGIESVTFTNSNANIARITKIVITYTPSSSGGDPDPCTTPTVAWNTKPSNGEVGGSMTASVTTNYSNGLTYSSSNTTVASVTNAGVIKYLAAGTTTITATVTGDGTTICEGPVSVQQEITVTAPTGGGGEGDGECTWELVTDASTLKAGDRVVIVANGYDYALGADRGNNRAAVGITKNNDNTITINNDVQILTLEVGTETKTFAFQTGDGYLYAAATGSNYLKTKTAKDVHGAFTIEINNGTTNIQAKSSSNRNIIRYNNGNNPKIFSCYSSGQQAICLYKEQCTTQTTVFVIPRCG